jgi:hypothetical protein
VERPSFDKDRKRVMDFVRGWKEFDWTAELDA